MLFSMKNNNFIKLILALCLSTEFLLISCSQPVDPSYTGPDVNIISYPPVVLVNQTCSITVQIEDNQYDHASLRLIWQEDSNTVDTTSWIDNIPTNTQYILEQTFQTSQARIVYVQAKGEGDETSSWSEPLLILASDDSVYFWEDFQQSSSTPDTNTWTWQQNGNIVISVEDIDTTKALLLYDPDYGASWITLYTTAPLSDTGEFSFNVWLPASTDQDTSNIISFRSNSLNLDWDKIGFHFGIVGDSIGYKIDYDWHLLQQLPSQQWNQVTLAFNSNQRRYHLYLNQQCLESDIEFDGTGQSSTYLQILCPENGYRDSIYLDDIKFKMN